MVFENFICFALSVALSEGGAIMNEDTQKVTLTVKEIQGILRIGQVNAYNLIHRPGFPVLKIGHSYRIPADAFYDWLRKQEYATDGR